MSNLTISIREALGEQAPAQLEYATETADGVAIPLRQPSGGWNRVSEERELGKALAPLIDSGWEVKTGPIKFREGTYSEIIVQPPEADGIDTATLPLRDRIRVEARAKRKNQAGGDFVDKLEINEQAGEVAFSSTGAVGYQARLIEQMVDDLRKAGWTGPIGRRFGEAGIYGTLTAPKQGLKVKQARIDAFLV